MTASLNRKNLIQIIQLLTFFLLYLLFGSNTETFFLILKVYAVSSFIVFLTTSPYPFVSPYTFIMIFLYVYNCGEIWLILFGIPLKDSSFSIKWFSEDSVVNGFTYVLAFLTLIQFFVALTSKKESSIIENVRAQKNDSLFSKEGIDKTATMIFSVALVFATIFDVLQIRTSMRYGYVAALRTRSDSFILSLANAFMPLLIFCIIEATNSVWKRRLLFVYAVVRYGVYMIIVGSRLLPIAMFFCLLLIYYKDKKKNAKQMISLSLLILIIIVIGTFVSEARSSRLGYLLVASGIRKNNPVVAMIQELGGTFIDVPLIMDNINTIGYAYGKTYLFMGINMIPKIGILFPWIHDYESFSSILNSFFFKGRGLGGSFLAELYYNFGWFTLCLTPIIANIYKKITQMYFSKVVLDHCIGLYLFLIFGMYVRGTAGEVTDYFRIIIYYHVIYSIFVHKGKLYLFKAGRRI